MGNNELFACVTGQMYYFPALGRIRNDSVFLMFVKQLDENSLIVGAPAKVNLFLEVLHKRADGYHEINSLFQAVSLFDRLTGRRRPDRPGVEIRLKHPADVPTDDSNLIARAYELMRERFGLVDGLDIELDKNIPVAAGLGGGSSDAAATITTCNILFSLGLTAQEMADLGAEIGSDIPFFFSSGQALVSGRGEVVTEVALQTDYWLGLVTPAVRISTAEAYRQLSLGLTKVKVPVSFRCCKELQELVRFLSETGNDFESIQLGAHPQLEEIKNGLSDLGALLSRMSGSGPTVFGLYIEAPDVKSKRLQSKDERRDGARQAFAVRPIVQPA